MEDSMFTFKQFKVRHGKSSMKVGVDAVLLGAWAGESAREILDIGTGCGVVALILAQRFPDALIEGVDIDCQSIEEASINFKESPWSERLDAFKKAFPFIEDDKKYDLIVSNPPYFNSGLKNPSTQREKARHQDRLTVFTLIENCGDLLTDNGRLSMIFPIEFYQEAVARGLEKGLFPIRECFIKDREGSKEKRVLLELGRARNEDYREKIILFTENREPTKEYRKLCKDLYLKF